MPEKDIIFTPIILIFFIKGCPKEFLGQKTTCILKAGISSKNVFTFFLFFFTNPVCFKGGKIMFNNIR